MYIYFGVSYRKNTVNIVINNGSVIVQKINHLQSLVAIEKGNITNSDDAYAIYIKVALFKIIWVN